MTKKQKDKKHIVIVIMGNIIDFNVHQANKHDTRGGVFVFEKALFLYLKIEAGCADEGYRGTFKNTFELFHNVRIDISKQIKLTFEILSKRWCNAYKNIF